MGSMGIGLDRGMHALSSIVIMSFIFDLFIILFLSFVVVIVIYIPRWIVIE
jgi:hypothetical protein